ncbi:hypothetical protein ACTXT7_011957 [Hymenolepis weldensis]
MQKINLLKAELVSENSIPLIISSNSTQVQIILNTGSDLISQMTKIKFTASPDEAINEFAKMEAELSNGELGDLVIKE